MKKHFIYFFLCLPLLSWSAQKELPGIIPTKLPDKNPYTEMRRIIEEQGSISQDQLEELANSMAPAPEGLRAKDNNDDEPYNPSGYMLHNLPNEQATSADEDAPYMFGFDNKKRAKELMDMRREAIDANPEPVEPKPPTGVLDQYLRERNIRTQE